jgi:hypothetical protein
MTIKMDIIYAQDPFLCNCRPANAGAYRNSGAGNVPPGMVQEQGYPSPAHKIIFSIRLYSSELVLAIMVTKLVSPAISELKSRNKSL